MTSYVLIADASVERAILYADLLRVMGFAPLIAEEGTFAVATLTELGPPSLLVVDLALPRIDGFGLIRALRRLPGGDKTVVVAMSTSRDLRDKAIGQRARLGVAFVLAHAASGESMRRVFHRLLTPAGRSADDPLPVPPGDSEPSHRDPGIRLRVGYAPVPAARARLGSS